MSPLYAHCPHCGYPVVVRGVERLLPRFCRQCRTQYVPGSQPAPSRNPLAALRQKLRAHKRAPSKLPHLQS